MGRGDLSGPGRLRRAGKRGDLLRPDAETAGARGPLPGQHHDGDHAERQGAVPDLHGDVRGGGVPALPGVAGAGARRKIILVLDRHAVPESAAVQAWVAARRERLELVLLPVASPQSNPVEYLNNDLKGRLNAEHLPGSRAELVENVQRFLTKLQGGKKHVMSYFQHPKVQYAAVNL